MNRSSNWTELEPHPNRNSVRVRDFGSNRTEVQFAVQQKEVPNRTEPNLPTTTNAIYPANLIVVLLSNLSIKDGFYI